MKKLILLVTFTLLACNSYAQWNPDVWPTTNHFRFTDTNDYVNVKDRTETYKHTQYMTVSSTYPIPVFSSNGFHYISSNSLSWNEDRYSYDKAYFQLGLTPNWYVATNNITDDLNFNSNTNTFHSWVLSTGETNAVNEGPGSMDPGADYSITNTYAINVTNLVTEIMYATYTNIIMDEDFYLDVKELRSLDTFEALNERKVAWEATSGINNYRWAFNRMFHPVYFRGANPYFFLFFGGPAQASEKINLEGFKDNIVDLLSSHISTNHFDADGTLNEYWSSNVYSIGNALLTKEEVIETIGCPTNYFEYTPYRNLNGSGYPIGREVTSSFIVTGTNPPPGLITNDVSDYGGNAHTIIGTNGQVFTYVSTNTNIEVGFTEQDYGWEYITNAISMLNYRWGYTRDLYTPAIGYGLGPNWTSYIGTGDRLSTYDAAIASASADWSGPSTGSWVDIYNNNIQAYCVNSLTVDGWRTYFYAIETTQTVTTASNLYHEAQAYGWGDKMFGSASTVVHDFTNNGTGLMEYQYAMFTNHIYAGTSSNIVMTLGDADRLPDIAVKPTSGGNFRASYRTTEYPLGAGPRDQYPYLIWYDFEYK